MKRIFKTFMSVLVCFCYTLPVSASESEPYNSGKTVAQLVTSHDRALPGSDIQIALSMRLEKHWHTYWRNAGGPGKPARFIWALPDGYKTGEIIWPLPQIVHTGPTVNYAFEDRLLLPMSLHISDTARIGDQVTIETEALYLVCYILCLPEGANLSLTLEIGEPILDARWNANIKRALKSSPKQNTEFQASAHIEDELVLLDVKSSTLQAGKSRNPYFYPYVQDMIDANDPQNNHQFGRGIQMVLKPSWKLEDGLTQDITGVLAFEAKTKNGWKPQAVIITANAQTRVDLGTQTANTPAKPLSFLYWLSLIAAFIISFGIGAYLAKRRGK